MCQKNSMLPALLQLVLLANLCACALLRCGVVAAPSFRPSASHTQTFPSPLVFPPRHLLYVFVNHALQLDAALFLQLKNLCSSLVVVIPYEPTGRERVVPSHDCLSKGPDSPHISGRMASYSSNSPTHLRRMGGWTGAHARKRPTRAVAVLSLDQGFHSEHRHWHSRPQCTPSYLSLYRCVASSRSSIHQSINQFLIPCTDLLLW